MTYGTGEYTGLRYGGGTQLCTTCGGEACHPVDPDNDSWTPLETEDGVPMTTEHFPEAELVCRCGNTWPRECGHDTIDVETEPANMPISDGKVYVGGTCRDCENRIEVALRVTHTRVIE